MHIYLDHAATTQVRQEVLEAMNPYFTDSYANASSLHSMGQEAREAVEKSRETVANFLGVPPETIYFTSGGTESNNTIIKGIAQPAKSGGILSKKPHIITTSFEHPCIMNSCEWLKTQGVEITYLPVGSDGVVNPEDFQNTLRKETVIASIMTANNEIGTIQPIKELSKIAVDNNTFFHTDAVQAYGKIPLDMENVGALSISAHKLYGPKGVGALYSEKPFTAMMHGGGHERGQRSGTENVPGIVGLAKATELAAQEMDSEAKRQIKLRNRLIDGLLAVSDSRLNGHRTKRLPNNVNVSFMGIEGESLVLLLDQQGIEASTGSACSAKSLKPSHVLMSLGLKHIEAHGSLRLTLGRQTTDEQISYALENIPEVVAQLRKMSPIAPEKNEAYEDKCFKSG